MLRLEAVLRERQSTTESSKRIEEKGKGKRERSFSPLPFSFLLLALIRCRGLVIKFDLPLHLEAVLVFFERAWVAAQTIFCSLRVESFGHR